jgi:predicted NAD/FAD-binding protein
MPERRLAWSSWNYRAEKDGTPSVIYWMNSLQQVSKKRDYFVSINDPGNINPERVIWEGEYEHPVYDVQAVAAQKKLSELNRGGPVFFCGSYFKYGFHEDAFCSGMAAAGALLGREVTL